MTSYFTFARSENLKPGYWISGNSETLRTLALQHLKFLTSGETLEIDASEIPESELISLLYQSQVIAPTHPYLVLIHDGGTIKDIETLQTVLTTRRKRKDAGVVVVLGDSNNPEMVKSSVLLSVECSLPKTPVSRQARVSELLRLWCPWLTDREVRKLCNAELADLYQASQKIEYLGPDYQSYDVLQQLIEGASSGDFVTALLSLDKITALRVDCDFSTALPILSTYLHTLAVLHRRLGRPPREVAAATELNEALVRLLLPYAQKYTSREVARRAVLLEQVDAIWRKRPHQTGLKELLVAQW